MTIISEFGSPRSRLPVVSANLVNASALEQAVSIHSVPALGDG